jgi:glyoxylase-like metal-dependent hydrolase (beta-lactamase superfamily II)
MTPARRVTTLASVVLAPNPGPMTLDGTNSYLLGLDGGPVVVVDPGPSDPDHLAALAVRQVELILITHRHGDHTESAVEFGRMTGAPVRARDPEHCHGGGAVLEPGERIEAAGIAIDVVASPGHTADSVCFHLPDDSPLGVGSLDAGAIEGRHAGAPVDRVRRGSVLTGDTILGRGTTVLAPPDGDLGHYLATLRTLIGLGPCHVLPAHGPDLPDLAAIAGQYLAHREERLGQIRSALLALGPDAGIAAVTDLVYGDVDPRVRWAAEQSVGAQMAYLRAVAGPAAGAVSGPDG